MYGYTHFPSHAAACRLAGSPARLIRDAVINRAVNKSDHNLFSRLQYRIANKGEAPPNAPGAVPAAANYLSHPTTPTPNGRAMSNGYQSSPYAYPVPQPSQPARTLC
jgi:hypothetical protein